MSAYDLIEQTRSTLYLPMRDQYNRPNGVELNTNPTLPASYSAQNSAALSEQVGVYLGGNALRVTYGGVASPYARRTLVTNAYPYWLVGAVRGDGVAAPTIYLGSISGAGIRFVGTNSVNWQPFAFLVPATDGTFLALSSSAAGAGQYCDFAAMSVQLAPRVTQNVGQALSAPSYVTVGDGVTAATMPTQLAGKRGMNFNGAQYLTAAVNLPNGLYTYVGLVRNKYVNPGAAGYLIDFRAGGGTGYVYHTPSTRVVTAPSGTISVSDVATSTLYSGSLSTVGVAGVTVTAPTSATIGVSNTLLSFFYGDMLAVALYPGTLAPLQIAEVGRRMRQEALMP